MSPEMFRGTVRKNPRQVNSSDSTTPEIVAWALVDSVTV